MTKMLKKIFVVAVLVFVFVVVAEAGKGNNQSKQPSLQEEDSSTKTSKRIDTAKSTKGKDACPLKALCKNGEAADEECRCVCKKGWGGLLCDVCVLCGENGKPNKECTECACFTPFTGDTCEEVETGTKLFDWAKEAQKGTKIKTPKNKGSTVYIMEIDLDILKGDSVEDVEADLETSCDAILGSRMEGNLYYVEVDEENFGCVAGKEYNKGIAPIAAENKISGDILHLEKAATDAEVISQNLKDAALKIGVSLNDFLDTFLPTDDEKMGDAPPQEHVFPKQKGKRGGDKVASEDVREDFEELDPNQSVELEATLCDESPFDAPEHSQVKLNAWAEAWMDAAKKGGVSRVHLATEPTTSGIRFAVPLKEAKKMADVLAKQSPIVAVRYIRKQLPENIHGRRTVQGQHDAVRALDFAEPLYNAALKGSGEIIANVDFGQDVRHALLRNDDGESINPTRVTIKGLTITFYGTHLPAADRTVLIKVKKLRPLGFTILDKPEYFAQNPGSIASDDTTVYSVVVKKGENKAIFDNEWNFNVPATAVALGGLNSYGDLVVEVELKGDGAHNYGEVSFSDFLRTVPLEGAKREAALASVGTMNVHVSLNDQSNARKVMRYFARDGILYGEHGTHTAATNAGFASPDDAAINRFHGGAPEAKLILGDMKSRPAPSHELIRLGYESGARVTSNSYGIKPLGFMTGAGLDWTNNEPKYEADAARHDQIVYDSKDYVMCFSSGNYGKPNAAYDDGRKTLGMRVKTAKNIILVGASVNNKELWKESWKYHTELCPEYQTKTMTCQAKMAAEAADKTVDKVADFSSRGPAYDKGRIKPDIVAPGEKVVSARENALGLYDTNDVVLSKGRYFFQNKFGLTRYFTEGKRYRSDFTSDFELRGRVKIEFLYAPWDLDAHGKQIKLMVNTKGQGAAIDGQLNGDGWSELDTITLGNSFLGQGYSKEFEMDHMQARIGIFQEVSGAPYDDDKESFFLRDYKMTLVRGGPPHVKDGNKAGASNIIASPPFKMSWRFNGNNAERFLETEPLDIRQPTRLLLTYTAAATGPKGAAGKTIKVQKKIHGGAWANVKEITLANDINEHTVAVDVPGVSNDNGRKTVLKIVQEGVVVDSGTRTNVMVVDCKIELLAQDIQSYENPLPSKGVVAISPETRIDGHLHTSHFKFDGGEENREFVTRSYDTRQPLRVTIKYEGSTEAKVGNRKLYLDKKESGGGWTEVKEITITDTNVHTIEVGVTGDHATKLKLRESVLTGAGGAGKSVITIHAFSLDLGTWHTALVAIQGTSMATPTVAGGAALVREYYRKGYYTSGKVSGIDSFLPSTALVKATIINSGQEIPKDNLRITGFPGFEQGFGRMALDKSLYFAGKSQHKLMANKRDMVLGRNEVHSFDVEVKDKVDPLKVTLVWTDPAGTATVGNNPGEDAHPIINDLELLVTPLDASGKEFDRNVLGSGHRGLVAAPKGFTKLGANPPPYSVTEFTFGTGLSTERYLYLKQYDLRRKVVVSFWATPLTDDAVNKKVQVQVKKESSIGFSSTHGGSCTLASTKDTKKYCKIEVNANAKARLRLYQRVQTASNRNGKEKIKIDHLHVHFDHWGNEEVYASKHSGGMTGDVPNLDGIKQIRSNNNVEQIRLKAHANNDKFRITVWAKSLPLPAYRTQDYALVATAKDFDVISPLYKVYVALDNPNPKRICDITMKQGDVEVMRRFSCPNEEHIFDMRPLKKFASPPEVTVKVKDLKESCVTTVAKMHVLNVADKKLFEKKECTIQIDDENAGLLTRNRWITTKCSMQVPVHTKHMYKVFLFSDPLANEGRSVPLAIRATLHDAAANKAIEVYPRAAFNNGQPLVSYASFEAKNRLQALKHVQLQTTGGEDWAVGGVLVYDAKNKKTYFTKINSNVKDATGKIALGAELDF